MSDDTVSTWFTSLERQKCRSKSGVPDIGKQVADIVIYQYS